MKTIYTDRFGIFQWATLAVATWQAISAILAALSNKWAWAVAYAVIAAVFFFLAAKRIRQRRVAVREGRDPSVIRVSGK